MKRSPDPTDSNNSFAKIPKTDVSKKAQNQDILSGSLFEHFPREIMLLIILKLDVSTFYKTLPLVCKECYELFLENFHDYHL